MARGNLRNLPGRSQRRKQCAGSVDRNICDLPDCILSHIISFLPTKNAVATSILSQRWKFLWTMTNNLDFQLHCGKTDQFVRFVNHVLLLHKPAYLNRLSLRWSHECIQYYVNSWITAAVLRNVHELFLWADISKLPRIIFSCESVQSLELDCSKCTLSEIVVSLPRLQSLRLFLVSFDSEEALCKILGGCPVLKSLWLEIDIIKTMERCGLDIDNGIEFKCIISSDSLRRLEVCVYDWPDIPISALACRVQLDAPLLEYIKLDQITSVCVHQSLVFLVEADISLVYLEPVFENQNYFNSVAKAFLSFDCVKTLTLSRRVVRALSRATIEPKPRFNSLTRLEVKRVWNWSSFQEFITLADCLEVLTVNTDCESNHLGKYPMGSKSDIVPRCFSNSLRTVSFDDFDGTGEEVATVGYILNHGSVLEVVHLRFRFFDVDAQYMVVKEISKLPRKSPICKVEFHDN